MAAFGHKSVASISCALVLLALSTALRRAVFLSAVELCYLSLLLSLSTSLSILSFLPVTRHDGCYADDTQLSFPQLTYRFQYTS